ncbi:MAG: DUF4129 domain-containing protein [Asgard group archaeon]|nr:DUF4129 domain-containing protein [Asgard group archaeon]
MVFRLSDKTIDEPKKKKVRLFKGKLDRRYIVMMIFLVVSVVSVAYSTRYLFRSDISEWTITQGDFDADDHAMNARGYELNWAYHNSSVAYGEWQWNVRTLGGGPASIIFIGSNLDLDYASHPSEGYKLEFQAAQKLELRRLTGTTSDETIGSAEFYPETKVNYQIRIIRYTNSTFFVIVNDQLLFNATDDTYITSEVFFLDWTNIHILEWVVTSDSESGSGWHDFFSGFPSVYSNNFFTKISLYLPFVTLALVLLFYLFRLFFAQENWTRFLVPLLIAVIMGVGYGYLFEFLRQQVPDLDPDDVTITDSIPSQTGTDTNPYNGSDPYTPTTPITRPTPSETQISIPKNIVSIVLMAVAGTFIVVTVVYVAIDFFKKREAEFHELAVDAEKRYIPSATSSDHRLRVIRAYHQASYDLIDHGAKSEKDMTPGEFGDLAQNQLELTNDSLDGLTDLYEEARYSEHDISSEQSETAEEYYDQITDDISEDTDESSTSTENESKENSGDN